VRLAEENRLSRTRDELIFNVSSTFYSILGQEKVIDSLKFSLQAMEEQRRKMAQMVEVAKAARVDLMRTEVRVADLEQGLVKEENVLDIQKRVLATLLGLDEKVNLKIAGKLTFEKKGFSSGQLVPQALDRRPDYQAARDRVEAVLDYPIAIIPGMFARLKLPLQTVADATVVPREAVIVTPNGERIAFVIKEGKALRRKLETGIEGDGRVQIITGLQPGKKVVVAGNEKLRDGMEVKAQGGDGK